MKNTLYTATVKLPDGTRKWVRAKTKEELEQKKAELLVQIGAGLDVLDDSTFGQFAAIWLNTYKRPYLREKSLQAIENALNNHILPYLDAVPLKKVTPIQVQLIMATLSGKSKSLNNQVIQTLRNVCDAAVDNNLLLKSPVPNSLRVGGIPAKEKTALTPEQSQRLLDAVNGTRAYLFCLIALQTGMRRGEICGLMWSDIDFQNRVIHVRHNAILKDGVTTVSENLKTACAERDLPIPDLLYSTLREVYRSTKSVYVVPGTKGAPMTKSSFKRMMDIIDSRTATSADELGTTVRNTKIVRTLDFPVTAHQLRHTYITRLFESGLDIKEIQYLAGHSTVDMTLRVYTHYQKESRQAETAKRVKAAFGTGVTEVQQRQKA